MLKGITFRNWVVAPFARPTSHPSLTFSVFISINAFVADMDSMKETTTKQWFFFFNLDSPRQRTWWKEWMFLMFCSIRSVNFGGWKKLKPVILFFNHFPNIGNIVNRAETICQLIDWWIHIKLTSNNFDNWWIILSQWIRQKCQIFSVLSFPNVRIYINLNGTIFDFWTICWMKQDVWRCHFGLSKLVSIHGNYFYEKQSLATVLLDNVTVFVTLACDFWWFHATFNLVGWYGHWETNHY